MATSRKKSGAAPPRGRGKRVAAVGEPAPAAVTRVRKNMRLDQSLLDEARRALDVADETEAVTIALRRVVDNERVAAGIRSIAGRLKIDESRIED